MAVQPPSFGAFVYIGLSTQSGGGLIRRECSDKLRSPEVGRWRVRHGGRASAIEVPSSAVSRFHGFRAFTEKMMSHNKSGERRAEIGRSAPLLQARRPKLVLERKVGPEE